MAMATCTFSPRPSSLRPLRAGAKLQLHLLPLHRLHAASRGSRLERAAAGDAPVKVAPRAVAAASSAPPPGMRPSRPLPKELEAEPTPAAKNLGCSGSRGLPPAMALRKKARGGAMSSSPTGPVAASRSRHGRSDGLGKKRRKGMTCRAHTSAVAPIQLTKKIKVHHQRIKPMTLAVAGAGLRLSPTIHDSYVRVRGTPRGGDSLLMMQGPNN
ncbi:hypothetical protein PAHAL_7G091000 [Panicum hallii]|uniref:Uncharacterized protein n=2 Tax=Panicum hallii TaxID=206008 RepID=A0A2S3I5N4_9POAL|nr:hypothetical protein PAHAL_7G091000 [Panicum hallii]